MTSAGELFGIWVFFTFFVTAACVFAGITIAMEARSTAAGLCAFVFLYAYGEGVITIMWRTVS